MIWVHLKSACLEVARCNGVINKQETEYDFLTKITEEAPFANAWTKTSGSFWVMVKKPKLRPCSKGFSTVRFSISYLTRCLTMAKELKQIAMKQETWGKWNTATAWNRYYEAARKERPVLFWIKDGAVYFFGLAFTGLLVHSLLKLF